MADAGLLVYLHGPVFLLTVDEKARAAEQDYCKETCRCYCHNNKTDNVLMGPGLGLAGLGWRGPREASALWRHDCAPRWAAS
jgi:hypothetical protein